MTRHDRIHARIVQDVITTATGIYWRRRAETFDWARPRPTDYVGQATPEQITERDRRLADMATRCRQQATLYDLEDAA